MSPGAFLSRLRPTRASFVRLGTAATLAVLLATVDVALKAGVGTPPWALHQRSGWWEVGSVAAAVVVLALSTFPSPWIVGAAAVAAGGVLGNLVSGVANGRAVPNPFQITTGDAVFAFNLADVFTVGGALALTIALSALTIRHRHLLPTAREVRAFWRARLSRILQPYQP